MSEEKMQRALDQELSAAELDALHTQISESPDTAQQWERLQQVDQVIRETPLVAPLPGFTERVMAAIAAMPLPGFAKGHMGLGLALGLLAAALLTLPLLSVVLILLLSVATNPSALNSFFQSLTDSSGTVAALAGNAGDELAQLVTKTPVLLALLTVVIPLTALWVWWVWHLWRKPSLASEQQVL
ncbi:MAG TPA: sigma-E factor negative regulatory protein [Aggregatilineaceae bacterium]|nr:sigma-E factor negative regulatory protein [Aggregatilineaceae bacterium]